MRIGIDCRNYGPSYGYMGEYVLNLVSYLEKLEDGNEYVLFFDEKGFYEYESSSSRVQSILTRSVPFSLWEQIRFPLELSKAKIEAMLFFHASIPLFFFKAAFLSIADLADFFYPNKELKSGWGRYSHGFLLKQSVKRAEKIIVQSHLTKHDIIEVFNIAEEHVAVIPPMDIYGTDTVFSEIEGNTYLMKENISPSFLLFAWDIREHKNIPRLLEAYSLLAGKVPDLVLAGREDPDYHEVRGSLIRLGLQSRVHVCNPSARELQYLSSHAIAHLCPSLYEGSVQYLLMPMRSKLPVVASMLPIREDVLSKDGALFFRAMSREDMKETLQKIITNPELRARLSGKNHDTAPFSVSSVSSQIGALFTLLQTKISGKKEDAKGENAII